MADSIVSPGPGVYRVDTVRGDQGNTFQVVRCEPVAKFDNQEHAAFLVDLLLKGIDESTAFQELMVRRSNLIKGAHHG